MTDPADIPVMILCGGKGMRIRQVSDLIAKPMLRIGTQPVLWHIMRIYRHHGFRRFVLCLGYLGDQIKDYFVNYYAESSDITVDFSGHRRPPAVRYHPGDNYEPDWEVTLVETGADTKTGGRVARAMRYISGDTFMLTYGDGVGNLDLGALLRRHRAENRLVTVTGVRPASRFGHLELSGDRVVEFAEKPQIETGFISGGFMAVERAFVAKYLRHDEDCILEQDGLPAAARDGAMALHRHEGFWMPMDNHVEYAALNEMWANGSSPWKVW